MFVWLRPAVAAAAAGFVCERSWLNWRNLLSTKWDGLWWPSSISCVECGGTRKVPQGDASFPTVEVVCVHATMCRHDDNVNASMSHSFRHYDALEVGYKNHIWTTTDGIYEGAYFVLRYSGWDLTLPDAYKRISICQRSLRSKPVLCRPRSARTRSCQHRKL